MPTRKQTPASAPKKAEKPRATRGKERRETPAAPAGEDKGYKCYVCRRHWRGKPPYNTNQNPVCAFCGGREGYPINTETK